jgi:hypothetical protein
VRAFAFAAALTLTLALTVDAQTRVTISDVGPGASGRILDEALRRPHRLVEPDTSWFILPRGQAERTTLIVLGRTAAIAGKVDGDVIVVGGDLFVRPGAEISGTAVAIGGGVYPTSLAFVGRGTQPFRDNTFDIIRVADGYRLSYRSLREGESPPLLFPGIYGLRFPQYDRVNGASIPFGPSLTFAQGRGEANGVVTYRSDLGKIDPRISGRLHLSRRLRVELEAERGTFTNDAWILPHYVNSLSALFLGTDTRNYYRADRAQATMHRVWESARGQLTPLVGFRVENAWSVGPAFGEQRGPWSMFRKTDSIGMWRPNPAVAHGELSSLLVGGSFGWELNDFKLRARSLAEVNVSGISDRWTQVTSDFDVGFLTFGEQEYGADVHWVATGGATPPPQRYSYLGGQGTMPFLELLQQGGDQVLLIDQRYAIPLSNRRLGFLGIPTLQLRHRIGSAGVGRLPSFEQVIGAGVMLTVVRAEVQVDPSSGRVRFGAGFTFAR